MTTKVFEFLNDSGGNNFTETSTRPPVPGEENELQSNGGMSTRSSGSHRSNKSHASSKSAASNKGDVTHSPAATPRKSNLEKGDAANITLPSNFDGDDADAPLGFEPEGSAANSPPYSENSTPPHLKWAENLHHLLTDSEGVSLFKEYLEQEQGGSDALNFWFACQGLKRKAGTGDVMNIVKVIFKTYIRLDKVKCISKDTKKEIVERLNQKSKVDQCVFDEAQTEVEDHLRDVSYPAFLNSDLYVQYVNNYADSPKSSHSSGSNSARPVSQSGVLPVLHEDEELKLASDVFNTSSVEVSFNSRSQGSRRSDFHSSKRTETFTGYYPFNSRSQSSYPAHVSYAPVSAQDSELQSLSSDALTDDTVSLTDTSSLDGNMTFSRKRYKKAMKTNALHNREIRTGLHSQIIPRTERAPKDRNIAETDPTRFATLLIEKLGKEVVDRETKAKMQEKLDIINREDESVNKSVAKESGPGFISLIEEETAESILDLHCSRIWSSSQHTPSRSPGRQSPPRAKSPERMSVPRSKSRQIQHLSASLAAEAAASTTAAHLSFQRSSHHRSKKDSLSKSMDSGVGEDKALLMKGETHRHIHHHHHHHHPRDYPGRRAELDAQQSNVYWRGGDSSAFEHSRGRTSVKKGAPRKGSDVSSNIDSGISMAFETDSTRVVPNWNNPSSEKVMKWMMESETITGNAGSGSVDTDRSSSTKRSSRYPSASATSLPHKQSSKSGKTGPHLPGRSASTDRSNNMLAWGLSGTMPNQPFIQDSSMPLPTPPNPTTQLEEAKRRLEEQRSAGPVKSKSFPVVPSKEKGRIVPGASGMPPPANIPSVRTVPSDLDSSLMQECSTATQPSKNSSSSSSVGEFIVVGMYYEQEPIPYRFQLSGKSITLEQIKHLNSKRGTYKYFFKRDSDEFGEGAVFEEIIDDHAVVPMWAGKIVARLQKVE